MSVTLRDMQILRQLSKKPLFTSQVKDFQLTTTISCLKKLDKLGFVKHEIQQLSNYKLKQYSITEAGKIILKAFTKTGWIKP